MPHTDNPGRPWNAITCSCGAWWTGLSRSHCPAENCHQTFSCDSAAEKHRQGAHGVDRHCADPAEVGLVARQMPFGALWGWPGSDSYSLASRRSERGAA